MAEYSVVGESNFFRVKDEAAFLAWAQRCGLLVGEGERNRRKCFSIFTDEDENGGGWPTQGYDEEAEEEFDIDVESELAAHLQEGCVAILTEAGTYDGCTPYGYAVAINSKGDEVRINLDDIEDAAKHLGEEIL